ncbi:MAG TPA: ABC-F family ATP-binding cassette domain-containing protein, partial [Chitinophagaceae bacterium]|nr:ABC-F family ATP-binding cassette domain-containing protein [Chitinophagaceae bacterium]
MHVASVERLSKSYGVRRLFSEITFHISEGDKIALIARNGFGKSTLLNILAGLDTGDDGSVWIHKEFKLILLHQDQQFSQEGTVLEQILSMNHPVIEAVRHYEAYMEGHHTDTAQLQPLLDKMDAFDAWNMDSELKQILSRLKIHDPSMEIKTLSGGQKKRVALARALTEALLYNGKCLLVLDEPTNHLDLEMIEWLENYLSASKVTLLMVTHDRYFLDEVCNEIIELEDEKVYIHKGNYAYFLEQKAHRLEVGQSELLKDRNIFRKELEWMRKQPRARTTKSKSRQDAFYEIEEKVKAKVVDLDLQLQVKMNRLGGKVLELKKVYKSYGDKVILKGFDYTFKRGERIGIVGKNGVGKSTFLQIALHQLAPDSGKINHGDTVVFGHFSQEGLQYKEDKRVIEFVRDHAEFFPLADGTKLGAAKFLERFAFSAEQQYTYLSK